MKDRTSKILEQYEQARSKVFEGKRNPAQAAQELFDFGYQLDQSGKRVAAENIYQQTIEMLENLSSSSSGKFSQSQLARLAYNHGKALVRLGRTRAAVAAFRRSIELLEILLGRGANSLLLELRASSYAWLAIAQRKSGLYSDACSNYEKAAEFWDHLEKITIAPVNPYSGLLGATYLGYARALEKIGKFEESAEIMRKAEELLQEEMRILSTRSLS